jgi:type VI secretion system protein ImpH
MSEDDPDATQIRRPAPAPPPPAMAPPPAAPPAASPPAAPSPLDRLTSTPELFDLDQAAHVIAPGTDPVELPFASLARLNLPLAEVARAEPAARSLATPLFGLIGPGGVLPRHYTATTAAEVRRRSRALQRFMELLARRFTGMWVRAGAKYRPTRDAAPTERALDALIGMGTPGLAGRLPVPAPSLRYHAGHLAHRTRSTARLAAMLAEETGAVVEIVEFAGGWLRLPVAEQTRLGRAHAALGADAAAGAQIWDPQARFIIRVGPLDAAGFARLLPGQPLFERLCDLTRLFVGPEMEFVINPLLHAQAVPAARLAPGQAGGGTRLGYTSWIGASRPRRTPGREAMLRPPPIA